MGFRLRPAVRATFVKRNDMSSSAPDECRRRPEKVLRRRVDQDARPEISLPRAYRHDHNHGSRSSCFSRESDPDHHLIRPAPNMDISPR